jgi:hypothetical protein
MGKPPAFKGSYRDFTIMCQDADDYLSNIAALQQI